MPKTPPSADRTALVIGAAEAIWEEAFEAGRARERAEREQGAAGLRLVPSPR